MKKKAGWHVPKRQRALNTGREVELQITALTNAGDGLGRLDNRVVFVPFTMPGDTVRIKVTQEKKSFVLGQLNDILEPSPDRIDPRCGVAGTCGGCDWQHVPYPMQLEAKQEQLIDTLKRVGSLESVKVEPIIAAAEPFGYRNRIQGEIRQGAFHFKQKRTESRVAVTRCEIADERINAFIAEDLSSVSPGKVEIGIVDGEVHVHPLNERRSTDLGFRQVNSAMSEALTQLLMDVVIASDCNQVHDLYCGRGDWTMAIANAQPSVSVMGVDSSEQNIAVAQARSESLPNVTFERAKVEALLSTLNLEQGLCIVDPPRSGLDASLVESLCRNPARELIYVSCHPATLARDLKRLTETSYEITRLQPLDMFPQTAHLECFVHLRVREAG